jgi:DNA-directed RNA polymerase subunit RPC12/RpoP
MGKLDPGKQTGNVNVTLDPLEAALAEILGNEFPCPLCGAGLPIGRTKRNKPYCTCNYCGIQLFVRGKVGIARLRKLARDGILISGSGGSASHGIALLNRLEQLKLQRRDLVFKRPLIFADSNVENAIELVDAEIKTVQVELAVFANSKREESQK